MTSRPLSDLTVSVHARRIVVGHTQPYALVVTGRGLRPGPCRPHYEMMSVADQQHQNDDDPVLQGAVRLLNTARGLRSKLVASDSESLNGARLLSALIAFVLLDVLLW